MLPVKCDFAPGKIGIITGDLSRFAGFNICLEQLLIPRGSDFTWMRGNGFAANRNLIVSEMTPEQQWVWFIDDDHEFEPDLLMALLTRNVDIVQPLCSTRKPPFLPYAYMENPGIGNGYRSLEWAELPPSGIKTVDAVGSGGALISREAIEAVGAPWFEEGKITADTPGEDLCFMRKAKHKGFQAHVDLDTRMGHTSPMTVWPGHTGDKWCIDIDPLHGARIRIDANFGKKSLQEV